MNGWQKLRLATAVLAALVGARCFAAVGDYFVDYVMSPPNSDRHTYLVEAVRWSAFSLPPFALSAILALTVRKFISRKLLWLLSLPVFAAGLLLLNNLFYLERVTCCSGCFIAITLAGEDLTRVEQKVGSSRNLLG